MSRKATKKSFEAALIEHWDQETVSEGQLKRDKLKQARLERNYQMLVEHAAPIFDEARPGKFQEYLDKIEAVAKSKRDYNQKYMAVKEISDTYRDLFKQAIYDGELNVDRLLERLAEGSGFNSFDVFNMQNVDRFLAGTFSGIVRPFSGFMYFGDVTEVDEEEEIMPGPSDLVLSPPYDRGILNQASGFIDPTTGRMFTSCTPPVNQSSVRLEQGFHDEVGNRTIEVIGQIEVISAEAIAFATAGFASAGSRVRFFVYRHDLEFQCLDDATVKDYSVVALVDPTTFSLPLQSRMFNVSCSFPTEQPGSYQVQVTAHSYVTALATFGGGFTHQDLKLKNIIVRFS